MIEIVVYIRQNGEEHFALGLREESWKDLDGFIRATEFLKRQVIGKVLAMKDVDISKETNAVLTAHLYIVP